MKFKVSAASQRGWAHPVVYASKRPPPSKGLCAVETYAKSVASTGVLQGDAARANVRPAAYACARNELVKSGFGRYCLQSCT